VTDPHRWTLLIDRYLAGECSEDEQSEFTHLLGTDPDLRAYFLKMSAMRQAGAGLPKSNVERALSRVKAELGHGGPPERSPVRAPTPKRFARIISARTDGPFLKIAAAIVVALLAVPLGRFGLHRLEASRIRTVEFATTAGQRSHITLPDGSQVELAPLSHLVYSASDVGTRSLDLTGEAYFAVVHNAARRFRVHAKNAIAEDIGTRFVVRAYPTDGSVRVAVAEGSVALSDSVVGRRRRPSAPPIWTRSSPGRMDDCSSTGDRWVKCWEISSAGTISGSSSPIRIWRRSG
jgi:transmembrane sensor